MSDPAVTEVLPLPEQPGEALAPSAETAGNGKPWWLRVVPALDSLREYSWPVFRADLVAGLTVAAVAVPQAMAYAVIIGLPPHYGLYTAIVMTAVGALFDSSKQLINGPTNAISIAILSVLVATPEAERLPPAILLALLVGAVQLGITLLRLGDLSRYISHAVIVGFTAGAAVLLVLDQSKNLLGMRPPQDASHYFILRFWQTLTESSVHLPTLAIGATTIVLVLVLRQVNKRLGRQVVPEFLLVVIAMGAVVAVFDLDKQDVRIIGNIPQQLPSFAVPDISLGQVQSLGTSALAIALLGLLEAIAMAKAIAAQTRQKLDINQQCLSEGLANAAGSFFQCFPGSGSLTRSAINQQAGGQTQWSGVFCATAVALTVLLFADLARFIPLASLAGILMVSAFRMIDQKQLLFHLRTTRFDRGIVLATAFAAVFISVEFCILIGVVLSFLLYVPRAAKLHVSELTLTPERVLRERVPADPYCGRMRIYDLEGELFFGSAPDLEKHFAQIEGHLGDGVRIVVLRVKRARNPDAVCLAVFDGFLTRLAARHVTLLFCGVRPEIVKGLRRAGLSQRLGPKQLFPETGGVESSTLDAVRHAYALLSGDVCRTCPRREEMTAPKEAWYYMI
jgi:SulP family sulfate permease